MATGNPLPNRNSVQHTPLYGPMDLATCIVTIFAELQKAQDAFALHQIVSFDVSRDVLAYRFKHNDGQMVMTKGDLFDAIGKHIFAAGEACARAEDLINTNPSGTETPAASEEQEETDDADEIDVSESCKSIIDLANQLDSVLGHIYEIVDAGMKDGDCDRHVIMAMADGVLEKPSKIAMAASSIAESLSAAV